MDLPSVDARPERIRRSHAPANWYGRKAADDPLLPDAPKDQSQGGPLHRQVGVLARRKARARMLAKDASAASGPA